MVFLAGALAGGNLVAMGLRVAGGLLTARVMEPALLGLFNAISLVLGWAPILQLGILNGLSRELPYFVGKDDFRRVDELAAAAQAWALLVGGAVAAILLMVAGWFAGRGEWQLAAGWTVNAFGAWFLFYSALYLQTTYRTRGDFARLAAVNALQSALALALVLLVWLLSFYGLCLRALLVGTLQLGLLWRWRPIRVAPRWDGQHLVHLLKVGAPIFGVGQIYACWTVLDSTLVLKFEGTRGLGLYSMALMAASSVQLLPDAVSQVLYPRMAEEHGRGGRLSRLLRMAVRPTMLLVAAVIPMAALGWISAPALVAWLVPKYVEAVPAMRWALLVPLVMSLSPVVDAFNVVRRQDLYVAAMVGGMGAYGASLFWLRDHAGGLDAFPKAMTIGRLVFVGLCFAQLVRLARTDAVVKSGTAR